VTRALPAVASRPQPAAVTTDGRPARTRRPVTAGTTCLSQAPAAVAEREPRQHRPPPASHRTACHPRRDPGRPPRPPPASMTAFAVKCDSGAPPADRYRRRPLRNRTWPIRPSRQIPVPPRRIARPAPPDHPPIRTWRRPSRLGTSGSALQNPHPESP
jgi:hypothetical protein